MRPVTNRFPIDVDRWVMGLITEASPLNFPEGSSLDEENFILDRDGSRRRRPGIDFEPGYTLVDLGVTSASAASSAFQNFLWNNVAEDPSRSIWVHQFGNRLYFFNAESTAASANIYFGGPVSLTATIGTRFSFANIQGKLVVAAGDQDIRVLTYQSSSSYTVTSERLKVRDFWGVEDSYGVDVRPTGSLTSTQGALHTYNLYNQGWPAKFFVSDAATPNPTSQNSGTTGDPLSIGYSITGWYPSNADIIYTAMTFMENGRKAYFPYALENIASGNTPAPKGHYIIDLFDRSGGRSAAYTQDIADGKTTRFDYTSYLYTDQSTGGVKNIAAYAGRIWFACSPGETGGDDNSPHVGTFVLFSQLVDSVDDIFKCYQEADPTAEDISDLVDTDGGYIQLPDAVNIKALIPFKASLLVFADNGVWEIAGGDRGFTATEYQSKFLTNNGAINAESIVISPDAVLYWGRNGIYAIQVGQVGDIAFQSLTENTIQSLYNDIPYNSKAKAVGYYDEVEYKARWLYQETYDAARPQGFTHELILDFSMPAWSKFTFQELTNPAHVTGYVSVPIANRGGLFNFKYTTFMESPSGTALMTFSYFHNTWFRDWAAWDISATSSLSAGVDAEAYLVTGYIL